MEGVGSQVAASGACSSAAREGLGNGFIGDLLASSSDFPLAISVTMLDTAMAAPHPKVRNLMSFDAVVFHLDEMDIMSPQMGLPTSPTPSASFISPTFTRVLEVVHNYF